LNNNSSIIQESLHLSILLRIISILGGIILIFGIFMHFLEPSTFPTIFDGVWWAVVTVFTVGYGDYVPKSFHGKMIATALILLGTGLGSYYMISFATELISRQYANQKGQAAVSIKNHLIVVGWNERVKLFIHQYQILDSNKSIVLIDESLPALPADYSNIFFVKGCPHHDETMTKANIRHAHEILITADQEKNESDADIQSILTALTAKGLNPEIHCAVEILTLHQVENAKRAGADEVVQVNKLASYALLSSILFPSAADTSLYNQIAATKVQLLPLQESQSGVLFRTYSQTLLDKDMLLLGVQRKGENYIHPVHPFPLEKDDILIVIRR
jgi:voltage-gated potassium channel